MSGDVMTLWRCKACKTLWRRLENGRWSLFPGETPEPCCDNVPMNLEPPVPGEPTKETT